MNTISVREQPQYTQQIIAYLQQVLSTWCQFILSGIKL